MERLELVTPGRSIRLLEGDITRIAVDAIVNAANSAMAGGGGVDGAIHRAGGPELMRALDAGRARFGRVPAGQAVATGAGRLPARFVFHAVGPIYRDGASGEAEALASCYSVCLHMAEERDCRSISFPAISTGVYGYPPTAAARIALGAVRAFLRTEARSVEQVTLVQFGAAAYAIYESLLSAAIE